MVSFTPIQVTANVTASRATFCSPSLWTANRYANPSYDTIQTAVSSWPVPGGVWRVGVVRPGCRRTCPTGRYASHRKFRGQGFFDHALSRPVQTLDQAGAER